METKLLPCPFCGGEARIKARYYRAIDMYDYSGVCKECNASMDVKDTAAEAIEAWNTRHERMCQMEQSHDGDDMWLCDKCERVSLSLYRPNYCSKCGAKVVVE